MTRWNHTHWLLLLVAALIGAGCGKSETETADTSGGEQSVETAPEPAAEQQRALADIATKLGGKLIYDGTSPAKLAIGVDLSETQITDAGLEHLQGLTQLQELNLRGTQVSDSGLQHLQGLTQLQRLHLHATQVTDAGVKALHTALPEVNILGLPEASGATNAASAPVAIAPAGTNAADLPESEPEKGPKASEENPAGPSAQKQQETPLLAVAPFDATAARGHQESWSRHLGQPVEVTNSIGMQLALIPAGEFLMGSPDGEGQASAGSRARRCHWDLGRSPSEFGRPGC